jgi:hypothetical protein
MEVTSMLAEPSAAHEQVTITNLCPRILQGVSAEEIGRTQNQVPIADGLKMGDSITLDLPPGNYRFQVRDGNGWHLYSPVYRLPKGAPTEWVIR